MRCSMLLRSLLAVSLVLGAAGAALAIDADGDGFDGSVNDCDDNNSQIHPGAFEFVGDSVDEDCDGGEICYLDNDDDGARLNSTIASTDVDCADVKEATAADPLDCDDSNAAVHPGGVEVCDAGNTDEDCDGLADDSDPEGAAGQTTFYADNDGDGYGVGLPIPRCHGTSAESSNAGDCDDNSNQTYPGASELVGDSVDEDCDGGEICYLDNDDDGSRSNATIASTDVDCADANEATAAAPLDCDDAAAAVHPGAAEVCTDAIDNDCNMTADCADSACTASPGCVVEVFDHLECFKIKTAEKLKGTVTLNPNNNPPFALAAGCTIGKAAKYCVPVSKTVSALDSSLVADPSYVGQELTNDRICYKVKCPDAPPAGVDVHDQFGTRHFEKLKVSEVCTPAEQAP